MPKMLRRSAAVFGIVAMLIGLTPISLTAAPAVQLITPYPALAVEAGKSATFNVQVITSSRQRVDLAVIEAPPGWAATIRGGGSVIRAVFGAPENPPSVELEVRVPAEAQKGTYRVLVRGTGASGSDTLRVDLEVADVVAGAVTLSAEFPTLRGTADQPIRYSLTLTNNTPEESTFSLSAQGPEGWSVTARPTAQTQASTVKVEGGGTANVEVEADPPDAAAAGQYEITVRAVSGNKSAETKLTAELTGKADLTINTPSERLNADAVAGKETTVQIVIRNGGSNAIADVSLTSTPPAGWEVTFEPEKIDEIKPRSEQTVRAKIRPNAEAVAGDYVVTLAANSQGTSDSIEMRVTVETSRLWGLLGIALILLAVFILLRVFRRYGRR